MARYNVWLTFDRVQNPLRACHAEPHPNCIELCFAPQLRALFEQLNVYKCSGREVSLTFWLRNVLRATTAFTFSSTGTAKSAPDARCFLNFLTSKCASCHNGVQFFISHVASWLRTRRFSEPTCRGATNHWKNTAFRDFSTFSRTCIFFLFYWYLFSDPFSSDSFSSLTLLTTVDAPVHKFDC